MITYNEALLEHRGTKSKWMVQFSKLHSRQERGHLYGFGQLEDEAMALEEGVLFACDAGILDAMFECDSKIIFDDMIRVKELQSIS